MKRKIKLNEKDLRRITKKIIVESENNYTFNDQPITLTNIKKIIIDELQDIGYVDISPVIEKIHHLAMKMMDKYHKDISYIRENYENDFDDMINDLEEYD